MIRQIISIHAPREGGDVPVMYLPSRLPVFQSTPPARGATLRPAAAPAPASYFNPRPPRGGRLLGCGLGVVLRQISIHAPREGGDYYRNRAPETILYFNPRPPRGGRPSGCCARFPACLIFQSTPPARGATNFPEKSCIFIDISIHAPREGGDFVLFLFLLPVLRISIHAPREGGD